MQVKGIQISYVKIKENITKQMKDTDGEKNNAGACVIAQKEDKKKREHRSPFPSWMDGVCT